MLANSEIPWTTHVWRASISVALCWALYSVAIYIYRLTLHPLASYAGPKFAAASYLYEFWYDVVLDAQYTRKIAELHERFGKHL